MKFMASDLTVRKQLCRRGHSLSTQKTVVVTPVLKKSTLDPHDTNNNRPIPNLTFISKILKRCANDELNACFQQWSAKTILVCVQTLQLYWDRHADCWKYFRMRTVRCRLYADRVRLLSLLDLSAALFTVLLSATCPSLVYRRLLPVAVISLITYSSHGHVTWCYSWTTRVLRSGSLTWNAIPDAVRDPAVSLTDFRQPQKLKTYLVIWLWELAVWLSGNALASINVVALRQTQLVLGWVTVFGRVNHFGM